MTGYFLVLCAECRRLWVARPRGRGKDVNGQDVYGRCGAAGPSGYTCYGWLRKASESSFGEGVQAAWMIGGWEAVTALIDQNPAWAWYKGSVNQTIPQIHEPKCRLCGAERGAPAHAPRFRGGVDDYQVSFQRYHEFAYEEDGT